MTPRRLLRVTVAVLGVLLAGGAAPGYNARLLAQGGASYEQLQAFSSVLGFIRLNYVDSVGYPQLVKAAINGALHALDPHSNFISREDWLRRSALERGELATTGMFIEDVDSAIIVLSTIPRSPADKAGILPGDRIVRVNDTTLAGQHAEAVELRLAGERGSKVRVGVERGSRLDPDTFSVTLKRTFFKDQPLVSWSTLSPTTGYVRLIEFGPKSADQLHDAVKEVQKRGARQVILDLRHNPGGIVDEAVDIAALFLPKGSVVFRTRGRKKEADADYLTKKDGSFLDLPLIVLIDERSASASEALAGSLQDNDRALVMGRRSFGKALMQTTFLVMPTQDNVILTIGRVISPSGRIIQRRYKGLLYEQYRSLAGQGGSEQDTIQEFKTGKGRVVHGGGGIVPDVPMPAPADLPTWFSVASDSGFDEAVADSVASTLAADAQTRSHWMDAPADWRARLLPPFLERVRSRLKVPAVADSAVEARIVRNLAARAAEVRWGVDALEEFRLRNDPDIRVAAGYFPRIAELLKGP